MHKRALRKLTLGALICIASCLGDSLSYGEKRAPQIAYVDLERLMLSHPMSSELARLVSGLGALKTELKIESARLPSEAIHKTVKQHEEDELKPLPARIDEPSEPIIRATQVDLSPIRVSSERLIEVVSRMRDEAEEEIELLTSIRRAELREEHINRMQSLLERQSPMRTKLRVHLLSPSISDEERHTIISEGERLDAELEWQLAELKRKRDDELQIWRASLKRKRDEQFSSLKRGIEEMLSESIRLLRHEPAKPQWLNLRKLWNALSPREPEPMAISSLQRELIASEAETQSNWERQWKDTINLLGCEWMSNWQAALRKSVIELARVYALQRGFKALTTERKDGAVDITDEIIALLQSMRRRR